MAIVSAGNAVFTAIPAAVSSTAPGPSVLVANTLNLRNVNDGYTYTWPNITVLSAADGGLGIRNLGGDITLSTVIPGVSVSGSIIILGSVLGKDVTTVSGGNIYITGAAKVNAAGEPSSVWGDITNGEYGAGAATADGVRAATTAEVNALLATTSTEPSMYGQRIFIRANIINIDGIMQSGKDTYNLDLNADVTNEVNELLQNGASGRIYLPGISSRSKDFAVYFNTATYSLEVDEVTVGGGHIDLDGNIVSTGSGKIRVLSGYGTINIVNSTSFGLQINKIDASKAGEGVLTILDHSKSGLTGNPLFTVYTKDASGNMTVTEDGHAPVSATLTSLRWPSIFWAAS